MFAGARVKELFFSSFLLDVTDSPISFLPHRTKDSITKNDGFQFKSLYPLGRVRRDLWTGTVSYSVFSQHSTKAYA
jgi:hypothetical protein